MKTINVSDECFAKLRDQFAAKDVVEVAEYKDLIGMKLFIRTVTYHLTGRVVGLMGNFLKLEDAAWIADSGRFMHAIKDGTLSEVEPCGAAFVNLDSITDMFPWMHKLPMAQK